jgi:uncharacterized protein YjbI with pentapeptide repeats
VPFARAFTASVRPSTMRAWKASFGRRSAASGAGFRPKSRSAFVSFSQNSHSHAWAVSPSRQGCSRSSIAPSARQVATSASRERTPSIVGRDASSRAAGEDPAPSLDDASFHDASFHDASFHDASFHDASFHDASFHDASFHDASFHDHVLRKKSCGITWISAVSGPRFSTSTRIAVSCSPRFA